MIIGERKEHLREGDKVTVLLRVVPMMCLEMRSSLEEREMVQPSWRPSAPSAHFVNRPLATWATREKATRRKHL